MKKLFLVVTLLSSLLLASRDVKAQAYGSAYYDPYWDQFSISNISSICSTSNTWRICNNMIPTTSYM